MQILEKILVVDDDPLVLEMICDGLRSNRINSFPAKHPAEALEIAENENISFALIDYDLGWPEMNGLDLARELYNAHENLPVILMTGYQNIGIDINAMRQFNFSYLIKPFRIDQVLSLMERTLREQALHDENRQFKQKIDRLEIELIKLREEISDLNRETNTIKQVTREKNKPVTFKGQQALKSYERQQVNIANTPAAAPDTLYEPTLKKEQNPATESSK